MKLSCLKRIGWIKKASRLPDSNMDKSPEKQVTIASMPVVPEALPVAEIERLKCVDPRLVALLTPDAFEAEPYRMLSHLVVLMQKEASLQVLAISSASVGDGKTSATLSLAAVLARESKVRVLLLEADLRRPTIATSLGIPPVTTGLVDAILKPELSLEAVVQSCQPFHFDILSAGHPVASPYDVLKLPRFRELMQEARRHYDYVLVDTPPLLPFADCRLIERWVDGVLVIVAAHQTPRKRLAEALAIIDPTKLVGLVLNKDDQQASLYHDAYRYYTQSPAGQPKGWRFFQRRGTRP